MTNPSHSRFPFPAPAVVPSPRRTRAARRSRSVPEPDFSSKQIVDSIVAGYVEYLDDYLAAGRVVRRGVLLAAHGLRAGYAATCGGGSQGPDSPELAKSAARQLHAELTHEKARKALPFECGPQVGWEFLDGVFARLPDRVMGFWHNTWPRRACAYSIPQVNDGLRARHEAASKIARAFVSSELGRELIEWNQFARCADQHA